MYATSFAAAHYPYCEGLPEYSKSHVVIESESPKSPAIPGLFEAGPGSSSSDELTQGLACMLQKIAMAPMHAQNICFLRS